MGLASAQARFTTLTRRQNDLESRLMHNANVKLSLARQSSQASNEYTRALNATKVVWNATDGDMDLSYGLFNNAASNYILTNSNGALVVSEANANAWGLSADGALPASKEAFISKVTGLDGADTEAAIKLAQSSSSSDSVSTAQFTTSYKDADVFKYLSETIGVVSGNSKALVNDQLTSISYSPSGASSMSILAQSNNDKPTSSGEIASSINSTIGNICSDTGKALLSVITVDDTNTEAAAALASAISSATESTKSYYQDKLENNVELGISGYVYQENKAIEDNGGTNSIITNEDKGYTEYSTDISQVVATFMTFFDQACVKFAPSQDGEENTSSDYVNSNSSFQEKGVGASSGGTHIKTFAGIPYGVEGSSGHGPTAYYSYVQRSGSGGTSSVQSGVSSTDDATTSGVSTSTIKYLLNLYSQLSSSGYVINNNVTDSEYLEQQIAYGTMVVRDSSGSIKKVGDSGSPMSTVSDEEAIAKAKANYEATQDEISYKEAIINTDDTNTDSERAGVEKEMESVQKLIDSNIKKLDIFKA